MDSRTFGGLERSAVPVARVSDRRQSSLVRLRSVLRLAGRLSDVADVLAVRPIRVAEPARKRDWGFVRDRLLRLGFPSHSASSCSSRLRFIRLIWRSATIPSVTDYLDHYVALPFCAQRATVVSLAASGPELRRGRPQLGSRPTRFRPWAAGRPPRVNVRYLLSVLLALSRHRVRSAGAYVHAVGVGGIGLLSLQFSRPLLYAVYFFTGVGIGVEGIDSGLVEADGPLARRWTLWLVAAIASLALWMGVTALTLNDPVPVIIRSRCRPKFCPGLRRRLFFLSRLQLALRHQRSAGMASLSVNAYSLYLLHYVFDVWLQYALLPFALFAVVKGVIVFSCTVMLSWITTLVVQRTTIGARLIGSTLPATAALRPSSPSPAGLYARLRQFVSQ